MAFLIITRFSVPVLSYPLSQEETLIGRDPKAHIPLSGDQVSRQHARITWDGDQHVFSNLGRNGTVLNGSTCTEHPLSEGDVIHIGDWELRFTETAPQLRGQTVAAHTTQWLAAAPPPSLPSSLRLRIKSPESPLQKQSFKHFPVRIGSGTDMDCLIEGDSFVSRQHCVLSVDQGRLCLQDLGSRNGTLWAGSSITQHILPTEGSFTIGKTLIRYHYTTDAPTLSPNTIIGDSAAIQEIQTVIARFAHSDAPVCVLGESGSGKELVAHALHSQGARSDGAFVAINCGAIPASMMESELFGYERGAFTGATDSHKGVFEQANGGTLFLDEVAELPLELQTRFLRVLETRSIRRLGGEADIPVDVHIVSATHQDLRDSVTKGRFREDLFFRLFVLPLHLPPLRERRNDIPLLAVHFTVQFGRSDVVFESAALKKLMQHPWPGNVRELRNTIQRALLMADGATIGVEDIQLLEVPSQAGHSMDDQEQEIIRKALAKHRGNNTHAAVMLGISRTTLTAKIKKYNIVIDEYR